MASAAGHRNPKCHVLNFFYDKDEGCALTVLVNGVRFHIIADTDRLLSEDEQSTKLVHEYQDLLTAVKHQDQNFTKPCSKENLRSSSDPDSQDSGHGTYHEDTEAEDDQDSAVDVTENSPRKQASTQAITSQDDPEQALNNWMLSSFSSVFEQKAPPPESVDRLSISQWYDRTTYFYSLDICGGKLKPTEERSSSDMEKRMKDIIPKITLPKYIRTLDIPWYSAKDVQVLDASDDPAPYHPTRVQIGQDTFFLKVVDSTQPQPTKREINLMQRIEKLGLHKEIRVPLVKGLIGFGDSHTEIIGFLQTEIEDPTPLTLMLDEDVPQRKRDKWAKESERMINLLHEHKIIWGDAKADNFMVDKHDNLWIIDFGGSYTEGWVDPELMETVEGDDMGIDRIVNALHDPMANTWDPAEEDKTLYRGSSALPTPPASSPVGTKRKAAEMEDEEDIDTSDKEDSNQASRKRLRTKGPTASPDVHESSDTEQDHDEFIEDDEYVEDNDEEGQSDEPQYCICNRPSSGDMVGCDNNKCQHKWFHFECVGLKGPPDSEQWYCEDCRA